MFGHFIAEQVSQGFAISQWSGANVPTVGDTFGNPSYSAVVHTTYAINPNLLNEVAFNYNGNRINIVPFAGAGLGSLAIPAGYDATNTRFFSGPNNLRPHSEHRPERRDRDALRNLELAVAQQGR